MSEWEFFFHVLNKAEDSGHHLVRGQEVVRVQRIYDTLLRMSEVTGAGNSMQHEESKVMWVDGSRPINHFAVVSEGLAHEVDVLREGMAWALAEHQIVR
jgi:hypothetical protein